MPVLASFRLGVSTALISFTLTNGQAQAPGDSVFEGLKVHNLNVVFDRPWSEIEPILKENKEAEIYIPARLEINCIPADNPACVMMDSVGVRHKGNSTFNRTRQKNPFRFSFDEYGIDQRWDGLKGFVLNNGWNDGTFAREKLHYDFARRAGIPGPRATYTWLYVNGERFAFYLMVELVDKRLLESRFGDKDGDRFKATDIVGNSRRSDFTRRTPYTPEAYYGYYEANSDDTTRAWQRMTKFIDDLNVTHEDSIAAVFPSIVNVDDLYRAIGADLLLGNSDNYIGTAQNFNTYFPSGGGPMRWIIWDVSLTFSSSTTISLVRNGGSRPLTSRFMSNASLKDDYLRAVWFMFHAHLADDWILGHIDSLQTVIMSHVPDDTRMVTPVSAGAFTTLKNQIATRRNNAFASSTIDVNHANSIREGDVVLNEFSPTAGWVELYNARPYSIDLSGHSLTNDSTEPNQWSFPLNTFVPPRGHILVRLLDGSAGASGPTNFSLSPTGGHLRLTRLNGSIVDAITYSAQHMDSSFGRITDGAALFERSTPTPGKTNRTSVTSIDAIEPKAVVINEFMADNSSITAPSGIQADWIELYNNTSATIDLSGIHLSDNANNPAKWQFPTGTSIAANDFLVVWAYDTTVAGMLHAAWSLSKDGEHLRLSNIDLSVIDSLNFGPQINNRTTARVPNGTGSFIVDRLPTLGLPNGGGVALAGTASQSMPRLELTPGLARVRLLRSDRVRLSVFDARGREAAVLMEGLYGAGLHTSRLDVTTLRAGAYLFRLQVGSQVVTRRAIILR